ncbi:major head subunit [Roseibium sp. TrichSKD4]|uniref:Mu-like prophage major head subunit gpT family protein n=1 Tax=Roseibium sp. TrichSKD4 TaxID=744980 RepID=UPI0001E56CAB|nr:Mu-like prophage major head subunit gpT family protein [Roseibium sp. TrichSKD4]EFO33227.1 major head subunit [Roseibium sp. TrichSKD4]
MADFTLENLRTAGIGFRRNYQQGFDQHKPMWPTIATEVPSTTTANEYGWLGEFPGMREWIGERVIRQLGSHDYRIKNRKFELTVAFKLDDLADDNLGIYKPRMEGLGNGVARHPDKLIFEALELGFSAECYDGQNFFDTDHPVLDEEGKEKSVSNFWAGDKPAWYLFDTTRSLKPLVRQVRQKPVFNAMTDINSERVFMLDEVVYGAKTREAAGYGFWQLAFASKEEFTPDNFAKVYTAMKSQEGDYGTKLTIQPNILMVPPSLEDAANILMSVEKFENGKPNPHRNKCKVEVCPWLSS